MKDVKFVLVKAISKKVFLRKCSLLILVQYFSYPRLRSALT